MHGTFRAKLRMDGTCWFADSPLTRTRRRYKSLQETAPRSSGSLCVSPPRGRSDRRSILWLEALNLYRTSTPALDRTHAAGCRSQRETRGSRRVDVVEIDTTDMSQGQPRRPQGEALQVPDQPIKYGDVLDVRGELADRPVAPRDAALLQSAEQAVLGRTQRGGPAAVMQSAAALNARGGHVGKGQITGPAADAGAGATVTEADLPGRRVVTEYVGGQVVAKFATPAPVVDKGPSWAMGEDAVTIGRALESVIATAGDKPVDQSDAAAIQAAEMCATGASVTVPRGVAAAAQAAADENARAASGGYKVKLRDVLTDAREKMPADKGATGEDADRVVSAEIRNKLDMATTRGGVAEAVTAAARLNQERP